jgi:hypothetical protein
LTGDSTDIILGGMISEETSPISNCNRQLQHSKGLSLVSFKMHYDGAKLIRPVK